ncbi:DUF885 family protein [Niveispirillum sp.]|uniref:DUF885 domain-containing protein n=1 Tax=Niveispirillum sp. TaxID=1917217 RepID=UPI001B5181FB|nr:DUF885 domain-containing protein [Niveispirillum sp.]MBP7335992.1 DUF885 domain-containing protein [Niveispirillum sp.]
MADTRLHELADRYWAFQREEFPLIGIQAGQPAAGDLLLRDAPADHLRRAAWADRVLPELDAIDPRGLDSGDRTTHALLRRELAAYGELVACGGHLRPSLYPMGPDFKLTCWASATVLSNLPEARRYLARLSAVPAALAGLCETLRAGRERGFRYPQLVIDRAVAQVRGSLAVPVAEHPFALPLRRMAGRIAARAPVVEQGLALINDQIYPALQAYANFLARELREGTRTSVACTDDIDGDAHYRFLVAQATTLELSPKEIHALGLAEVDRISARMLTVAAAAGWPGDLPGYRASLQADPSQYATSADMLRTEMEVLCKRIDARIPEFFGRLPRATFGVNSIPVAISEKMPPAYAQPNPADGSAAGVLWITSVPGKLPRYAHAPIVLHDAWPGHLMQMALTQEMKHLPPFRRYGAHRYAACLKGWALYCEQLGAEMGLYDTPEKRYGRLEMEMWRAVRLVVDTGLHALGWSGERAVAFFEKHMSMPRSTVEAEVDCHVAMPAQALAYQLGNLKFREIRQRAEEALGDGFDLRRFHDALLALGPVPLRMLEGLMADWTARQTVRAA